MNHKDFEILLDDDPDKAIRGSFSWDGSPDDLKAILDGDSVSGNISSQELLDSLNLIYRSDTVTKNVEADPSGATSFVVAVILIYGLSIIFMIASSVFKKRKSYIKDSDKNINAYLEQAGQLRDESKKESFQKLKWSLIPVLAQSPSARALIAKRVKYIPYLVRYVPVASVGSPDMGSGVDDSEVKITPGASRSTSHRQHHLPVVSDESSMAALQVGCQVSTDAIIHYCVESDNGSAITGLPRYVDTGQCGVTDSEAERSSDEFVIAQLPDNGMFPGETEV